MDGTTFQLFSPGVFFTTPEMQTGQQNLFLQYTRKACACLEEKSSQTQLGFDLENPIRNGMGDNYITVIRTLSHNFGNHKPTISFFLFLVLFFFLLTSQFSL
jgi:hypothetical protein